MITFENLLKNHKYTFLTNQGFLSFEFHISRLEGLKIEPGAFQLQSKRSRKRSFTETFQRKFSVNHF